ncbi:hypothetical protein M427DRAFT_60072 [Gonapodya prolifera JEL478]|uniref:SNF5-domain-containing protein n=1 Tax=Gonapodya prolifera (strain JEL478) TaxID=1344416 RepID=A0A139A5B0_GONPJ|nr:hypothetical protein M427DRAFT_60072 [Gonapodya prolifera JEL478]|eukprot:KXS11934.1 hypothetical protein M427DRAFT_60072 [Gonapodya prolifera JEL478]
MPPQPNFSAPSSFPSVRRRGGRPPKNPNPSYRRDLHDDYEPPSVAAPAPPPTQTLEQIQARLQALQPGKRLSKRAIQLEVDRVRALEQQQRPFGGYFGFRRFQGRNRTRHKYFSKFILEQEAKQPARLVPIRIDVEADNGNVKLSDWFLWNLNERLLTPEQFARILLDDIHYTGSNATVDGRFPDVIAGQLIQEISQEIRKQCTQYAGAVAEGWDSGSWGNDVWAEDGGLPLPSTTDESILAISEPVPPPEPISEDEDDVARRKRERERERKKRRREERERQKKLAEKDEDEDEAEDGDGDEDAEMKADKDAMDVDQDATENEKEPEAPTEPAPVVVVHAPKPIAAVSTMTPMNLDFATLSDAPTPASDAPTRDDTPSVAQTPLPSVGTPALTEAPEGASQVDSADVPLATGTPAPEGEESEEAKKARYASKRPGGVRAVNEVTADLDKHAVDDESRVVVNLDLMVGNLHLLDRFEYPLFPTASTVSPEHVAHTICQDLGLPAEFLPLIGHAIREQVVNARLGLEETRYAGELRGKAFRKEEDEIGWGPGLEELSWDEVERIRKEKEKERRRRRIRQRGGPQPAAPPTFVPGTRGNPSMYGAY